MTNAELVRTIIAAVPDVRFFQGWFGTWDELLLVPARLIEDGDRVLVLLRVEGRGKAAGCRW